MTVEQFLAIAITAAFNGGVMLAVLRAEMNGVKKRLDRLEKPYFDRSIEG